MKKKFFALILTIIMSLGTVVNAAEQEGAGFSSVPITYSQNSTFTVVLPDSLELGSNKQCDFEIYLSEYDLVNGEQVKVAPINNTITMENQIVEIPYYVGEDANFYQGLPEFPKYYRDGSLYYRYDDYILTTNSNNEYTLYCNLYSEESDKKIYVNETISDGVSHYYINTPDMNGMYYYDSNFTDTPTNKGNRSDAGGLQRYVYDKQTNSWVYEQNDTGYPYTELGHSRIEETEIILQSTCAITIYNDGNSFIQYSKTVKDPIDVTITMSSNYLSDSTPITGNVDGSNLSAGNWEGEVVFEITLEQQ